MTDFEIRSIRPEEGDAIVTIEHTCFPPGVAETREALLKRVALAPELFTVAVEKSSGKLFLTCLEGKMSMYQRMHFLDLGMADSSWGGQSWHEMVCEL